MINHLKMKSLINHTKRGYFNSQNFEKLIAVKTIGDGFSFRAYLENEASRQKLSPWHDLPLKLTGSETDHFVAFFEISKYLLIQPD